MLDVYIPMMRSAAILAAGQLGLFEQLAKKPQRVAELAKAVQADPDALSRLLHALRDAGYVALRAGNLWRNTANTTRWFTSKGQVNYTFGLAWTADAWRIMADLENTVRRGKPAKTLWTLMREQPGMGARFSRYMQAFARHSSPEIARRVTLSPGARRILDIGGSHGLHSIALCKKYPGLCSIILDHASALTDTARIAHEHGLGDRISTLAGDCLEAAFPADMD
ncbi:MAG: methyltransferase dimerization domain-containing protein, partial [Planctomycetota bacterium]